MHEDYYAALYLRQPAQHFRNIDALSPNVRWVTGRPRFRHREHLQGTHYCFAVVFCNRSSPLFCRVTGVREEGQYDRIPLFLISSTIVLPGDWF